MMIPEEGAALFAVRVDDVVMGFFLLTDIRDPMNLSVTKDKLGSTAQAENFPGLHTIRKVDALFPGT
jgi:hypothetical protein